MIAEKDTTRTVVSTLAAAGAEDIQMSIAADAMAHVMDIMTNLYEHVIRAMIREYSTNALDAHIEAGVDRPIEVQLPSMMNPYLRIKDFGIGLDREGIRSIYSQYGASTKRATNQQTGMLGMGCKSALTYTDQFTVVSVKDGRRIVVSIERNEEGIGIMRVMSSDPDGDPTTEHNGTEVVIPCGAGDYPQFKEEADFFFSVWPEDAVRINGQKPLPIEGMRLTDDLLVIDGETSYVVMGNVPYPTPEIKHNLPRKWNVPKKSVMAFVPIGAVNFLPSREGLRPTQLTTSTLASINSRLAAAKQGAVQREIDKAATGDEAIQSFIEWAQVMGEDPTAGHYTYRGRQLPGAFVPASTWRTMMSGYEADTRMLVSNNGPSNLSRADRVPQLSISAYSGSMVVHGYEGRALTPTQKRKMQKYAADNSLRVERFVLVKDRPSANDRDWFGSKMVVPFETISALKLPTTTTAGGLSYGRLPGSYDFYEGLTTAEAATKAASGIYDADRPYTFHRGVSGDQIDQSKPIFYVHGNQSAASRYAPLLAECHAATGCYVVALQENRIAKFCRIIPTAKVAHKGVADAWKKVAAGFSADERLALHMQDEDVRYDLKRLDPNRLRDPELLEAIRVAQLDVQPLIDKRRKFSRVVDTGTLSAVKWDDPLEKYPLFDSSRAEDSIRFGDDMYVYLAAKYALLKSQGKC